MPPAKKSCVGKFSEKLFAGTALLMINRFWGETKKHSI
jgi:hypothetical protein